MYLREEYQNKKTGDTNEPVLILLDTFYSFPIFQEKRVMLWEGFYKRTISH